MMFSNLFHTSLTIDGFISISVRSSENRSDQFLFTKEEVKPALDDDPTDDCWSGSSVFQLKREQRRGGVRIWNGDHWTFWVVSRQDVELMNAHLYELCEQAFGVREINTSLKPLEQTIVERVVQSDDTNVNDEMLMQIQSIVRDEIQKGFAKIESLLQSQMESSQVKSAEPIVESESHVASPSSEFIPSDLSNGMVGSIQKSTQETKGSKALQAAKKLRGLKK